jgi:hypothetical protein
MPGMRCGWEGARRVGGGFRFLTGDVFEEVDGFGSGLECAEGEGLVGELAEFGQVGPHGAGAGEVEELERVELIAFGELDEVVAEDEEGGEEFGFARGEGGERTECWVLSAEVRRRGGGGKRGVRNG